MLIANVTLLHEPLNLRLYKRLEKYKVIHYIMLIANVTLLCNFKLNSNEVLLFLWRVFNKDFIYTKDK